MKKRLGAYLLLIPLLLCTCTFAPRDTGNAFMFALSPLKNASSPQHGGALVVALPTTSPELDTQRIALIADSTRWDYYASARWVEFLPALVQSSLTKTIGNSKLFKTATTDQDGLNGDLILKTEIRAFHAEYAQGSRAPVIRIHMTARLISRLERAQLLSFEIKAEERATGNGLPAIQGAFDKAFSEAQERLVAQLAQSR